MKKLLPLVLLAGLLLATVPAPAVAVPTGALPVMTHNEDFDCPAGRFVKVTARFDWSDMDPIPDLRSARFAIKSVSTSGASSIVIFSIPGDDVTRIKSTVTPYNTITQHVAYAYSPLDFWPYEVPFLNAWFAGVHLSCI